MLTDFMLTMSASALVSRNHSGVTLHGNAIDRIPLEFLDIDSVAAGLREVLSATDPPLEPVPIFANEDRLWR